MGSRFVRPTTTLLTISQGDTLTVKTRLTHGERADSYERQYVPTVDGSLVLKAGQIKLSMVTAYLIDWSLTDEAGKRVEIFQQPIDAVERILRSLSSEDFEEIAEAITAHEARQRAPLPQEKKVDAAPISPSPSAVAGAWTGSVS